MCCKVKKVIVIGCPGAGKSTFARALQEKTRLPLHHLDLLWHRPDGTHISREEFDAQLGQWLAQEGWILDGNYARTLERRLRACDTVFFLDYPPQLCLEGARSRLGTPRPDMPWVDTRLDPEFERQIRTFARDQTPAILTLLEQYQPGRTIHIFHSRQEADACLAAL